MSCCGKSNLSATLLIVYQDGSLSYTSRWGEPKMQIARLRFSLIELLVVTAIISVLAALLLPSLHRALTSSRAVVCQNNLKQIGTGLVSYASDSNNGVIIRCFYRSWITWGIVTQSYLTDLPTNSSAGGMASGTSRDRFGIWNCPENTAQNYLCNEAMVSEICTSYSSCGYRTIDENWDRMFFGSRISSQRQPSKLGAVFESRLYRNPAMFNDNWIRYAHDNRFNILFADLHITRAGWVQADPLFVRNFTWYAY